MTPLLSVSARSPGSTRRMSAVRAGTAAPRAKTRYERATPAIETTIATAISEKTSQMPRRRATIKYTVRLESCYTPLFAPARNPTSMRKWRNWQTRKPQELVAARQWRFKSSLPHQC